MKTFLAIFIGGALGLGAITGLSQTTVPSPALAVPPVAKPTGTPLQQLKQIRDQNVKLLEQQQATLKSLEEMEKTSQQLKLFGKRS